jgi:hypothetical protein
LLRANDDVILLHSHSSISSLRCSLHCSIHKSSPPCSELLRSCAEQQYQCDQLLSVFSERVSFPAFPKPSLHSHAGTTMFKKFKDKLKGEDHGSRQSASEGMSQEQSHPNNQYYSLQSQGIRLRRALRQNMLQLLTTRPPQVRHQRTTRNRRRPATKRQYSTIGR